MGARCFLVTGTTSGIGLATARALATGGDTVVMANRDPARGESAAAELRDATGNPDVVNVVCDLSSLASVRTCANHTRDRFPSIDVLINNAGVWTAKPQLSADGYELAFATNHLGPFLLTHLLLEPLRAAGGARIVNVASVQHRAADLDLDHLTPRSPYRGLKAYSRSKLANVMTTLAFARRFDAAEISANCLHPGVVASNIVPENSPLLRRAARIVSGLMRSPASGAATSIYLATSQEMAGVTGKYLDPDQRVIEPSRTARDEAAQDALWELSLELTGLAQAR
ncbi:MAG: SDR family NAD(P)-dependent oxidoreductase [Pseudomonadales bacterium]|nr:SDR family oxidoreductase [Pseudomonadales bacterium]NIX09691.1 SDR family NAD(P)-dependent oxidoreductase [Pseudomonadales bacterium]